MEHGLFANISVLARALKETHKPPLSAISSPSYFLFCDPLPHSSFSSLNMRPPPAPAAANHGGPPQFPIMAFFPIAVVAALAILFSALAAGSSFDIIHQVPEGHVGAYWRGGALLKTISEPGFHLMVPYITRYEPIQVTIQTDQVKNIPCGTKGGVMIFFEKIEVVNRLKKEFVYDTILNYGVSYDKTWIYDKIHHEINQFCSANSLQEVYIDKFDQIYFVHYKLDFHLLQKYQNFWYLLITFNTERKRLGCGGSYSGGLLEFCMIYGFNIASKENHELMQCTAAIYHLIDEIMKDAIQRDCTRYAPGIEIIGVRVTKPSIPPTIARNYEQMEEERTKVLIAAEKQRVVEKEAETQKKKAVTEAERDAQVSIIYMNQKVTEKESIKRQAEIENEIYLAKEKSLADADFYRVIKEAEANRLKLTPQFLELRFIEAIANNSKIYFGEKIPDMVMNQRLLGNYLERQNVKE